MPRRRAERSHGRKRSRWEEGSRILPDVPFGSVPEEDAVAVGATIWEAEHLAMLRALQACVGNRVSAARTLGIDRSTLRRKMAHYDTET